MNVSRRWVLGGLIAAPAVVPLKSLMPPRNIIVPEVLHFSDMAGVTEIRYLVDGTIIAKQFYGGPFLIPAGAEFLSMTFGDPWNDPWRV